MPHLRPLSRTTMTSTTSSLRTIMSLVAIGKALQTDCLPVAKTQDLPLPLGLEEVIVLRQVGIIN